MLANMIALSLNDAKSAVLMGCSPFLLVVGSGTSHSTGVVDAGLCVLRSSADERGDAAYLFVEALAGGGAVEAADLDAAAVAAGQPPDPGPPPPPEQRPHEADQAAGATAERDALARGVADLQLHPPLVAVEAHGPGPVGELDGLT